MIDSVLGEFPIDLSGGICYLNNVSACIEYYGAILHGGDVPSNVTFNPASTNAPYIEGGKFENITIPKFWIADVPAVLSNLSASYIYTEHPVYLYNVTASNVTCDNETTVLVSNITYISCTHALYVNDSVFVGTIEVFYTLDMWNTTWSTILDYTLPVISDMSYKTKISSGEDLEISWSMSDNVRIDGTYHITVCIYVNDKLVDTKMDISSYTLHDITETSKIKLVFTDIGGNEVIVSFTVEVVQPTLPTTWLIVLLILVLIAAISIVVFALRKRAKKEVQPPISPEEKSAEKNTA